VQYRGTSLTELDLDAVLARKPAVVLIDELAHTNAPARATRSAGRTCAHWSTPASACTRRSTCSTSKASTTSSRRATGVSVRETVPDAVLDDADEVELVDLPPDTLLERPARRQGLHPRGRARAAAQSFFQRGKPQRVARTRPAQDRAAGRSRPPRGPPARRRAPRPQRQRTRTVCVGPSPFSARLVRAAHRMTAVIRGELFAVFVAPPPGRRLAAADRERVLQNLHIAETLGARVTSIEGSDPAGRGRRLRARPSRSAGS
jgi:two-component system sensor histidine kinase KdpD